MRKLALSSLLAIGLAMPALAADVTIATAQGEVTLPANPARIAAYDVAAIDSLHALGATPVAAPDGLYVRYLDDVAASAAKIGTLFEPNLEALAAAEPDLIVIGGRSATQMEAVSQVATTIDMTIGPDLIADAKARITAYGTLLEKPDEAAALVADIDEKLAATKAAGAGKGKALIVMTNGPKLSAYGAGSRFAWIFEASGLEEAAPGLLVDPHGNAISHEFIAEHDPDWLIVLDRGAAIGEEGPAAEATLSNPLVAGTKAWKAGQVIYLSPSPLYIAGGGYTSLTTLLDELTAGLSR